MMPQGSPTADKILAGNCFVEAMPLLSKNVSDQLHIPMQGDRAGEHSYADISLDCLAMTKSLIAGDYWGIVPNRIVVYKMNSHVLVPKQQTPLEVYKYGGEILKRVSLQFKNDSPYHFSPSCFLSDA